MIQNFNISDFFKFNTGMQGKNRNWLFFEIV